MYEVVVAVAGNAAFCAALAAREHVGRVLMLEKAPWAWIGGNTYVTAGAFRTTFSGVEDLSPILHDVAGEQLARTELPPYTEVDFVADMNWVTGRRAGAAAGDAGARTAGASRAS